MICRCPSEIDNLVLEHLRAIRSDLSGVKADLKDVRFRIGSLERGQAELQVTLAHHLQRFDRLEDRIERIESRLGLVDA